MINLEREIELERDYLESGRVDMLEPIAEPCPKLIAKIVELTKLLKQYTEQTAGTTQTPYQIPLTSKQIVSPEGEGKAKAQVEELFTKALIQAINIKDCGLQPQENDLFKKHLQIEIRQGSSSTLKFLNLKLVTTLKDDPNPESSKYDSSNPSSKPNNTIKAQRAASTSEILPGAPGPISLEYRIIKIAISIYAATYRAYITRKALIDTYNKAKAILPISDKLTDPQIEQIAKKLINSSKHDSPQAYAEALTREIKWLKSKGVSRGELVGIPIGNYRALALEINEPALSYSSPKHPASILAIPQIIGSEFYDAAVPDIRQGHPKLEWNSHFHKPNDPPKTIDPLTIDSAFFHQKPGEPLYTYMYITLPMPISLIPSLKGARLADIIEIDIKDLPSHIQKAWNEVTIIDAQLTQPHLSTGQLLITLIPQRQILLNKQSLEHNHIPTNIIERAIVNYARAGEIV